jgi:hypothetical protein
MAKQVWMANISYYRKNYKPLQKFRIIPDYGV